MNRLVATALAVSALVLVQGLDAQAPTYVYSPAGAATQAGGSNNTIPWWGQSATYQQIHDYEEMLRVAGGNPVPIIMKGLGFRPSGTTTLKGRQWELRLNVGACPNSAGNASGTFSSNLPKPITVFATSTTFSKLSFPTTKGTGAVNPIAFTVPFNTSYIYVHVKNTHFCWEWRHQNSTTPVGAANKNMACDATSGSLGRGTVLPSIGTGCGGAKSTVAFKYVSPAYNLTSTLTGAPTGAQALAMIGLTKQQTVLPGWCSNLETVPLIHLPGNTFTVSLGLLKGTNLQHTVYTQYAFLDKSQPFGIGLSDASVYRSVLPGAWQMARIYAAPYNNTVNTHATATTGGVGRYYGLVVGFQR
ncbi:MAG: hypothetical protein ACYTGW_08910 [Planctomycetota bacterium]